MSASDPPADLWAFAPMADPSVWSSGLTLADALAACRVAKGGWVQRTTTDKDETFAKFAEHLSALDVLEQLKSNLHDNLFEGADESLDESGAAVQLLDDVLEGWLAGHLTLPLWMGTGPIIEIAPNGEEKRWVVEELHYGVYEEQKRFSTEKEAYKMADNRKNAHRDGALRVRQDAPRLPALPVLVVPESEI